MNLPHRLLAIAEQIPKGSRVADIGTDHALLPIYLIKTGICDKVVAGDLNEGPLEAARRNVRAAGLNGMITLKLGDGLEIIEQDTEVATIAGMGGATIKNIIEAAPKTGLLKKLVLQPMSDEGYLRLWLSEYGWRIIDEELICEDGRLYPIISAVPGTELTAEKDIISIGPRLFEKRHPLLKETISAEIMQNSRILADIERSDSVGAIEKKDRLKKRNNDLERILECL